MALPTNADVVVVRGYWLDEITGEGVRAPNGDPATVKFDPVPLTATTVTPNLRDPATAGFIKTRQRVATVEPTSGYFAALLVASDDPDLDAYGGRRVTMLNEPSFDIEVPYDAPTVTVDIEMSGALGLELGSETKAIWLVDAALAVTPAPQPPVNYLTSVQTLSTVAAGVEAHNGDLTAHPDLRDLIASLEARVTALEGP